MEEIFTLLTDTFGDGHHPLVETHTYPDASQTHSMYYFEDYFQGFVLGMTAAYPGVWSAAPATANVACAATQPSMLAWSKAFDVIFFGYLKRPFDQW